MQKGGFNIVVTDDLGFQ